MSSNKTRKSISYSPKQNTTMRKYRRRDRSSSSARRDRSRSRRRYKSSSSARRDKSRSNYSFIGRNKNIPKEKISLNVNDIFFSQHGISPVFKDEIKTVLSWVHDINLTIINLKSDNRTNKIYNLIKNTRENYKKTLVEKKTYNKDDLILLGVPTEFFNLSVFSRINDSGEIQYISCDNRRLCLLKKLYKDNIFDGFINVEKINELECSRRHPIDEPVGKSTIIRGRNNLTCPY